MAGHKGIASVSWVTLADGIMVGSCAVGVATTDTRTRVPALLADTSLIPWALSIDHTLWLALNVRIAYVVSNAFARSCIISLLAVSIGSTRRGVARLDHLNWSRC